MSKSRETKNFLFTFLRETNNIFLCSSRKSMRDLAGTLSANPNRNSINIRQFLLII